MGVSARVASLQKQLTARDEEIKRLKQDLDGRETIIELMDQSYQDMKDALEMQSKTIDLMMPLVGAAVDFILEGDGTDAAKLEALRAIVRQARETVEAAA